MNCHEFREMVDDYLDLSRQENVPGNVSRHLEHCEACREYLNMSKSAHITLFRSLNAAYEADRLPQGFSERLADSVRKGNNAGFQVFRLPKWPFVAAAVLVVAGFVSAAIGVANAVSTGERTVCATGDEENTSQALSTEVSSTSLCADGESPDALACETSVSETAARKRTASAVSGGETGSAGVSISATAGGGTGLRQVTFENVAPPYGAASSVATSCIELEARSVVRRPTNIIPLRILPCRGLYIVVS